MKLNVDGQVMEFDGVKKHFCTYLENTFPDLFDCDASVDLDYMFCEHTLRSVILNNGIEITRIGD